MAIEFNNNPTRFCWIVMLEDKPFTPEGITMDMATVFGSGAFNQTQENARHIIQFQFMPASITDMKAAIYNDYNILGRSAPIKSYSSSGARTISFQLEFFAHPESGNTKEFSPKDIRKKVDALRSLVYPQYELLSNKPPKKVLLRIGNQLAMIGVCKACTVQYIGEYPWTVTGFDRQGKQLDNSVGYAHYATVNLTFEEVAAIPESYDEIMNGVPDINEFGIYNPSFSVTTEAQIGPVEDVP